MPSIGWPCWKEVAEEGNAGGSLERDLFGNPTVEFLVYMEGSSLAERASKGPERLATGWRK